MLGSGVCVRSHALHHNACLHRRLDTNIHWPLNGYWLLPFVIVFFFQFFFFLFYIKQTEFNSVSVLVLTKMVTMHNVSNCSK